MSSTGRVVIVHGYNAAPDKHWFRWLADALADDGITTDIPALPDPGEPEPEAWDRAVQAALGHVDERTVVVGHSLGTVAAVRVLAGLADPWRLGGLVLVAGFARALPGAGPRVDAFVTETPDFARVVAATEHRLVVRSDNDTSVPPELSDELATALAADLLVVPGAGHFTESDGVTTLPQVRDAVRGWLVG